jgi:hypothetical protein
MKSMPLVCAALSLAAALAAPAADIRTDWLYHAAVGVSPASQPVPGTGSSFLTLPARPSDPAVVFVITPTQFAGDASEHVSVRWWDGRMAHWIRGNWIRNLTPADLPPDAPYARPLPPDAVLDLWRVEVPSWILQSGENFYAIQLKADDASGSTERYLLASGGGDFSRTNALGQVWSASEEFDGQDWPVLIGDR